MQKAFMKREVAAHGIVLARGKAVVLHHHEQQYMFNAHPIGLPNLTIPVHHGDVCIVGTQGLHEDFEDEGKNPV